MKTLLHIVVVVCAAVSASAHDFWLEPSTFRPSAGETVSIKLLVGENLAGEQLPRRPQRIRRFVAVMDGGETAVIGDAGDDPAGSFTAPGAGLTRVIYESKPSTVTLSAAKFEAYLREEGLERIIRLRAERGETKKAGREIFSRSSKTLIGSGPDHANALPLELIAEPWSKGDMSRGVRVLFHGKPLSGVLVTAMNRNASRVSARSDANGWVSLPIAANGFWMIKAVHMIEAPQDSGADWHSLWASVTLEH